jgi:CheY-like chemotaxis protein
MSDRLAHRSPAPLGRTRLVLIVEDDEDSAEALGEVLIHLGHRVLKAASASRAIELLDESTPNVVLLDLGLPDEDGCTLATAIRARLGTAAVRLVALTGFSGIEARERARIAGFDAFLTKPVTWEKLETEVLSVATEHFDAIER